MTFSSDTLSYKAYTYDNRNDSLKVTTQTVQLHKQPDGTYNVGPNQILIKIHSAALNPVDLVLKKASGFPITYSGNHGFGKDFSGTVAAVGSKAATQTKLSVGTELAGIVHKLFGPGTVAEYLLFDANDSKIEYSVPAKNLSLNEASSFPLVYGTAWFMLGDYDLKDKKVLVIGSSTSVGRYIVQLARIGQAKEIVVTCSGKSADLAKELGATTVIDYTQHKSVLNPVLESVKESGKFDFIMDCAGTSDLFPEISSIVHKDTHYNTIVGDKKANYASFDLLASIIAYAKSFSRSFASSWGLTSYHYKHIFLLPGKDWIHEVKPLFELGELVPFVDSVHKFEDLDQAVKRLESNRANGKVIIQVAQD
ncbi:NAD(P)-binding protein [Suhomyces tanzawaensis NRRL Y-17324]|uniref:NAD(P)-binding protein n=1 Tax=Suhomyces tanzawaensis NRRL Y-17324 TaxID=984487 RepID=A0A1E4SCM9_9ASCO|nr:NAD(P)-binding protein [Suhomyces tanzawaensis NRRL Y-17324]ODV77259.1 NAD(P)-binding protein [Suhomyces tanzawaensis NRRL Y-17324]